MAKIVNIYAREILDSGGNPTVEVELETDNHIKVISSVPAGNSVGQHEVIELRDNDQNRFAGMGVTKAIVNIKTLIKPALMGSDVQDQKAIDDFLIQLDGTPHKSKLGANAILGVSIAACKAAAIENKIPLYKYIQGLAGVAEAKMPIPLFNFIEGAKHADNNLEIQEFMMISDIGTYSENYRHGSECFHNLKRILVSRGLNIAVGHEGGFAPNLVSDEDALKLLQEAGSFNIALDFASVIPQNITLDQIVNNYPVTMLEDPAEEDDFEGWSKINKLYGGHALVVGDDIFATSTERLRQSLSSFVANAVIVKPNQIGTVTESIDFVRFAKANNFKIVVSHRSGETEDTFIADFAVGIKADYVKFGAPSRGERVCKYNRLLRIEERVNAK